LPIVKRDFRSLAASKESITISHITYLIGEKNKMASKGKEELLASIDKLSLSSNPKSAPSPSSKSKPNTTTKTSPKPPVADSWDEESSGEDTETENENVTPPQEALYTAESRDYPSAPPPTPASPQSPYSGSDADRFISPFPYGNGNDVNADGNRDRGSSGRSDKRPEKTDAIARRMIAGALGVRAPKKTDEQKAYEKAVLEKEARRKDGEKDLAKKREAEEKKARDAVWGD